MKPPPRGKNGGAAPALTAFFYRNFPNAPAPGKNREEDAGKFVILSKHGAAQELHLILSPLAFTPYHADIVYQYLQTEGRGRVEGAKASGCKILSPEWAVHGGGHFTAQHWLHNLILHGKSTAFGRYEQGLLEPFEAEIPSKLGLEGYTLEFR